MINPGQFLTHLLNILTNTRRQKPCDHWGCVLPVGEWSPWGEGPTCDVCRTGERPSNQRGERNDASQYRTD